MFKQIRDWLCPIILEQQEKLADLKDVIKQKEVEIQALQNKRAKWERDYRNLSNHHQAQMDLWETRFRKMIQIIEEHDLLSHGSHGSRPSASASVGEG